MEVRPGENLLRTPCPKSWVLEEFKAAREICWRVEKGQGSSASLFHRLATQGPERETDLPKATQHFQLFPIEKRTPSLVLEKTAYKMMEALIPHPSLSLQRLASNNRLPSKGAQLLRAALDNEATAWGQGQAQD